MIVMRDEHYVVEVNEGIYLRELLNAYRFTNDIKKQVYMKNVLRHRKALKNVAEKLSAIQLHMRLRRAL